MKLKFITSISKEYWFNTAQYCIPTWDLPGEVIVYLEPIDGDITWIKQIPFNIQILNVPENAAIMDDLNRRKVLKFWGKSYAQIHAHAMKKPDERIVWIDADVEQISTTVRKNLFSFDFAQPVAIMNSGDGSDCWETGIVVFNHLYPKLNLLMKHYYAAWNNSSYLLNLWKPYDAQVLGNIVESKGYLNLCKKECKNIDALNNTRYNKYFKHWINKENKQELIKKYEK